MQFSSWGSEGHIPNKAQWRERSDYASMIAKCPIGNLMAYWNGCETPLSLVLTDHSSNGGTYFHRKF